MYSLEVRKPGRSSSAVQVKATPTNQRFRDVFSTPRPASALDITMLGSEEVIPPSSIPSAIPSTGPRKGYGALNLTSASPMMDSIGRTPTKGAADAAFLRRANPEDGSIPPSPLMERRTVSAEQLFVPGTATKEQRRLSFTKSTKEGILATPIKARRKEFANDQDSQNKPPEKMSIYQQLGWDDEFDDL